ncbi:type I toxin-antitoxin system SymE family toxin [Clostridium botulinum]|uniref:Toxin SymE-like domain-containing protein n=1 Tax=Clostridium botulinum C/D str. DC5 TaxID=1443128 RepID=A0A0A0IEY4_CLOBO|nr:SymE family type I addiction module toxin [Clostridium botulinum]KGM99547.1 hypothetical protein Z955_06900 [Clostridium botulinum C/D str. DC5]KOC52505.1 hypothetical protein ADU89_11405 [Clostridium botulinum]KOC56493.1 hypothetical protein ADU90_08295 [Clostridium botulinum]MCD3234389.1 type I toxin-antitoxin system SymE family toxin [Clostridium botulinum D/C]MCD3240214.1 type I toxin-antitoxin system SymE family toxin [Clostridium botulinum D/C]
MERKNRRNFKVYESSVSSSSGYGYQRSTGYKSVPQIRMQGKWLEELGFETGSKINVECEEGKLVIAAASK